MQEAEALWTFGPNKRVFARSGGCPSPLTPGTSLGARAPSTHSGEWPGVASPKIHSRSGSRRTVLRGDQSRQCEVCARVDPIRSILLLRRAGKHIPLELYEKIYEKINVKCRNIPTDTPHSSLAKFHRDRRSPRFESSLSSGDRQSNSLVRVQPADYEPPILLSR